MAPVNGRMMLHLHKKDTSCDRKTWDSRKRVKPER
jgi:hypothetical protein